MRSWEEPGREEAAPRRGPAARARARQLRRDAPAPRSSPPAAGRAAGPGHAPAAARRSQGCPGPGGGGGRRGRARPARQAPVYGRHVHARDPERRALRHVLRALVTAAPAGRRDPGVGDRGSGAAAGPRWPCRGRGPRSGLGADVALAAGRRARKGGP